MRSQEVKDFIRKNSYLFKDKQEDISDELLVENTLIYAEWETIKELFRVLGLENTSAIFRRTIKRNNYDEVLLNFFTLLFDKYVPITHSTIE